MKKHLLWILAILASISMLAACGGDDESSTDGDGEVGTFAGYVVDFASGTRLADVEMRILNNDTGEIYEDIPMFTSDASGNITVEGIPADWELLGVLCYGVDGASVDTYQFNLNAKATNEKLWLVDEVTYTTAPVAAQMSLDQSLGVVAGAIYWVDENDEEVPVGCSHITTDPATEDIRYFNDSGLPVSLNSRTDVNPLNGYFIAANMDIGKVKVTAYVDDQEIGNTNIFSIANSICIANIYAETDSNPGTCE